MLPHSRVTLATALSLVLLMLMLAPSNAQLNTLADICKGLDSKVFPGSNCNEFVECVNGTGSVKRCPRGQKFDFKNNPNQCVQLAERETCGTKNGMWRQLMPNGGLIGVHCTLLPFSKSVLIWHRTPAGFKAAPGMESDKYRGFEKGSSLVDTANARFTGYEVGPQFCSGHNPLPDGSILSCGGEGVQTGTGPRAFRQEDVAINRCKQFSCTNQNDPSTCSWKIIGNLSGNRWYGSMLQFPAYNVTRGPTFFMHMGGSTVGIDSAGYGQTPRKVDWIFPQAQNGSAVTVITDETQFIKTAGPYAHYPILQVLPYKVERKYVMFQWANNYGELVTVDNPDTNKQPINVWRPLPQINPPVFTTYPAGGTFAFHALEHPWTSSKITIFGGHMGRYTTAWQLRGAKNANALASNLAFTMDLSQNSTLTWETEEMPDNALLRTAVILPNGKILLLHGARKGIEASTGWGLGCTKEQILENWIYEPKAANGQRWTIDPTANPTFRGYHSCAVLLPDGSIFAGGSDAKPAQGAGGGCTGQQFPFVQVDGYVPPTTYNAVLKRTRPRVVAAPATMRYNRRYTIKYAGIVDECSLVAPGANTHHTEQSSRVVFLRTVANNGTTRVITVETPPEQTMLLPQAHLLFCMFKRNVYSRGVWINVKPNPSAGI